LAAGPGLQMMAAMSGQDVARRCGPDGKHNPDLAGYRHGTQAGPATLDGHRVPAPGHVAGRSAGVVCALRAVPT